MSSKSGHHWPGVKILHSEEHLRSLEDCIVTAFPKLEHSICSTVLR